MSLTPGQKEAYARAHSSTLHVWTLEFRHSTFPSAIRYVNHAVDVTLTIEAGAPVDGGTQQLFTALGFALKNPTINSEPDTSMQIKVDGISGSVQNWIAAANATAEPVEATLRPYAIDGRTAAELQAMGVIHQQVRNIQVTSNSLLLQTGFTNAANRQFPSVEYTADSNPALI